MRTKKYAIVFLISAIFTLVVDLFFCKSYFTTLPFRGLLILDCVLFFLFVVGTVIIAPGLEKEPKNFVGRFLILTTVQMLSVLAVFAAVIFVKFPNAKIIVLHSLAVFVLLMVLQSYLLLKNLKK